MSAWARFWGKWSSCQACIRGRVAIGTVLSLVGSMVISFAVMYAVQQAAASASVPPAFAAGACADCPPGVALERVQVQAREGSILFAVGGTLPATVAELPADVRLEANDVEIVLRPGVGGFHIVTATKGGAPIPAGSLAAGIADGHLVVDVGDNVLSPPVNFAIGLWDGAAYRGRVPAAGLLAWTGSGAPQAATTVTAAPPVAASPTAAPTATAAPATGAPVSAPPAGASPTAPRRVNVTVFGASCRDLAEGALPAELVPTGVATGVDPDPRSGVATRWISTAFAGTLPSDPTRIEAFSVTVIVQRPGSADGSGRRLVDGAGSIQLWAYWDGGAMHKATRTWNGSEWVLRTGEEAEPLTVTLRTRSLAVFWDGLRPGDRYGALVAASGGCRAAGLDAALQPQQRIP